MSNMDSYFSIASYFDASEVRQISEAIIQMVMDEILDDAVTVGLETALQTADREFISWTPKGKRHNDAKNALHRKLVEEAKRRAQVQYSLMKEANNE